MANSPNLKNIRAADFNSPAMIRRALERSAIPCRLVLDSAAPPPDEGLMQLAAVVSVVDANGVEVAVLKNRYGMPWNNRKSLAGWK